MPSKSPCKPSQSSGLLLHGFPVTPHPFANIIFCYFKHLPTCPGRTAGRLLLGSLELIPRQELSSLPRSPGAQSCLSYLWRGGSSSCPGHPGSTLELPEGELESKYQALDLLLPVQNVSKKKELLATPRLCFSWLKASQELRVTPLPWGPGEQPPQPPSRNFFQAAQLRAGLLMSA